MFLLRILSIAGLCGALLAPAGFSALIDLAANGSASQSSNYGTGQFPASFGIDGNTGNFTHTLSIANSWWRYDFTTPQEVESLEIFNRVGCCPERLGNLNVRVTNDVGVLIFDEVISPAPGDGGSWMRVLPPNSTVKTVWIGLVNGEQNDGGNFFITIAELQLEDTAPDPPPTDDTLPYGPIHLWTHGVATQSSTHAGGYIADYAIDGNGNTFTHTVAGLTNQYWEYTFNEQREIHRIEVDNRADCCDARLTGQNLWIYDENTNLVYSTTLANPGLGATWALDFPGGIEVKTVRIGLANGQTNGVGDYIVSLGEVRMFAGPNLALNKPSYMVDLDGARPPVSNMNDGNTATAVETTTRTVDGYFEIDLEDTYALYSLRTIAASCCASRLGYARLRLFDANHDSVYDSDLNGSGGTFDFDFNGPICARYVRVGLENKQRTSPPTREWYIGVREIAVYGRPVHEVGIQQFAVSTNAITAGQSVNLDWELDDVFGPTLVPGVGSVGTNMMGGVTLMPSNSTSYILIATNACGLYEQGAAVYVDGEPLPIRINEFVADNRNSLEDGRNDASDWVELYNPNDFAVELTGWGLSDNPLRPMKWTFPSNSIPAFGYLVVFASGDNDPIDSEGNFHADWRISADGEPLQLTRPDGMTVEALVTNVPPQMEDLAYGYDIEGNLTFLDPTPGYANFTPSYEGWLEPIAFSHPRGYYTNAFSLAISNANSNATVYVSTDGDDPDTEYTAALPISGTTVVRAQVRRANYKSPPVDAHTYLFIEDTIASDMTTGVATDPAYAAPLRQGFSDIPTISISLNDAQPVRDEQAGSFEFIWPDGSYTNVQANCGLSRFGGSYTDFDKKNFRASFRKEYGTGKLNAPLLNGFDRGWPVVERFDELDIRAGSHDMVARGAYMSNRFIDDTLLDMGNLNPHGRFVHLFINGNYWGQYHLRERMVEAFMADYLGGSKEEYVSVRGNDNVGASFVVGTPNPTTPAHRLAWERVRNLRTDYEAVKPYLNVQHLVDTWLAWNWGNCESEYRAAGPIEAGDGFMFYLADADGYLRNSGNRTGNNGPGSLISGLRAEGHPDFKTLMADRIYTHFFNDGALTPDALIQRLCGRMDEIENSLVAETARWNYRTPANWLSFIDDAKNGWMQTETTVVLNELRNAGLFPANPPTYDIRGGLVSPGHQPNLSTSTGTIYYTLDGSDPRLPGGAISSNATVYTSGSITLDEDTTVNVRWFNGSDWSALNTAEFLMNDRVAAGVENTLLTEIHYNPDGSDEYEFIELRNISTNLVDLTGVTLSNAVTFTFPDNFVLETDSYAVVVEDLLRFEERYQTPTGHFYYAGIDVAGQWSGQLGNNSETVALVASNGTSIATITYATTNGWPETADGDGFSLELEDEASAPATQPARDTWLADPLNWRACCYYHGSPGRAVYCPPFFGIEMQGGTMSFETIPGEVYEIDYSDGLRPPNWQLLETLNPAPSNRWNIVDPQGYTIPHRVYRIRWLQ